MADAKCRSKNPSTCPCHEAQQRLDAATKRGDFNAYADARADFEAASVRRDIREGLKSEKEVFVHTALPVRNRAGATGFDGFASGGGWGNEMTSVLSVGRDDLFDIDFAHKLNDDGTVTVTATYTPDPSEGIGVNDPDAVHYYDYEALGDHAADEQLTPLLESFNDNAPDPWEAMTVDRVEEGVIENLTRHIHGDESEPNAVQRRAIRESIRFEHEIAPWLSLDDVRADYDDWVGNHYEPEDED